MVRAALAPPTTTSTVPSPAHRSHTLGCRVRAGPSSYAYSRGEATAIAVFAEALRAQGHACHVLAMTASEMEAGMLASGRADHAASEKRKLPVDRVPFNADEYMARFPELLPHGDLPEGERYPEGYDHPLVNGEAAVEATYLLGWYFTPKPTLDAPAMFFHPLFFGDFSHLKGKWRGVLGAVGKLDAAHHWVPITAHQRFANEDAAAWGDLLQQSKRADPSFDTEFARIITDGDKGLNAAHMQHMSSAGKFSCSRHRRENILRMVKPGGAETVTIFDKLVRAPKREHAALKRQLSAKAKDYLGTMPDDEQYMAEAEHMHGESTSNAAESMMAANLPCRWLQPLLAMRQYVEDCKGRFTRASSEMVSEHKKGTLVPPRVAEAVKPAQDAAHKYTAVTITNATKTRGTVGSATTPGAFYNCCLVTLFCDCGRPAITSLPCVHHFALCIKAGQNWIDFLKVPDTMYGWRMQFAKEVIDRTLEVQPDGGAAAITSPAMTSDLDITVFEFPPIPSEAYIGDCVDTTEQAIYTSLLMPPAIRRARGRPASQKRKRGVLELTGAADGPPKRKPPTCSNCQRQGHRKNSCPNLPRLAAPSGGGTPSSALRLAAPPTGGGSTSSAPMPLSASQRRTPLPPA